MKRVKIPKGSRKYYHQGYKRGWSAGVKKSGPVSKFHKGVADKVETATATRLKSIPFIGSAETPDLPTDTRALKWQGFTEAMNLIIASKR